MTHAELAALLEQIPLPACVMTGLRISVANQRLVALTGHTAEALLGAENPIAAFVEPEDQARVFALRDARQRGEPAPVEYDFQARAADGQRLAARVRIAEFPAAGPGAKLFIFTDERVRERSAAVIRGFVDVAVAAQQERTQGDFFRVVRERLLALGLTSTVLELDGDRFRIAPFAVPFTKAGAEIRERLGGWTPLTRMPIDVSKAEGTLVEDLPAFLAALGKLPETAFAGRVPQKALVAAIRVAGEPRYAISCSGEHLDGTVAGAFGLLARQLAAALESTRRVEELDRRNTELSMLLELGQEVVGALDVKQVLQAAARTAARALRCSCVYVMLPNEAGTALCIAAREDPDPPPQAQVGGELPLQQASLSALAFQTQHACTSTDNETDPRIDPEVMQRFRCRATLAVPLLSHGKALGVLSLFERGDRSFDALDVRLASHAAQLITAALENARLYAEQRGRAEEMTLLNEVARRVAGSVELRPLLELGGETLRKLLDGDYWFMLLPDAGAEGLRFRAVQPENADLLGTVLRFDQPSMAAAAWRGRRVAQVLDPRAVPAEASRELAARFDNRVTLAVPLIARDQILGVAVVLASHRTRLFSQLEMDRALAVAGQVALALLSARLYQDLRESYAELARTQKELIDRERMAALGELSASIAHEVRNPLGVIFNSVGSLRRLLKPEGDVALLIDIVGEEADRLNRMVGDLLDYSRPVQPALQPVPIQPLIEEALAAARQQIGAAAEVVKAEVRVAKEAATVRADARLLRQALVNLFLNAHQAMRRTGRLEIQASRVEHEGTHWARIAIRDSGPGIPPEAREKIFQPFFTTKPTGTGLGLAVVRRIVEGHGGAIELGNPPAGTEFLLRLPLDG